MRMPTITGAVKGFSCIVAIVAASAHGATPAARGVDDSRIAVTNVAGQVDVTMAGRPVAVREDTTVLLPARIVTGSDGTLGLTQAGTKINVAHDSDVEIPAEAVDGNLVARLVQHRGNVFYDVAPRDLGKLRVETPLLVAVIKGTQFNVAVQGDSTTIALFEGRLELRTPDGSDVIDLNAGEIAIRSLIDDGIRIVGMDDERVAAPRVPAADARAAPGEQTVTTTVAQDLTQKPVTTATTEVRTVDPETVTTVGIAVDDGAGVKTDLAARETLDLHTTNVSVAAVSLDASLDLAVTEIGASVDLDAELDLGASLDLGDTLDLEIEHDEVAPAGTGSQPTTPAPVVPRLGGLLTRP